MQLFNKTFLIRLSNFMHLIKLKKDTFIFNMQKQARRLFTRQSYYEKLKQYEPIINSKAPHSGFSSAFTTTSLPVLFGGFATAFFPHYNLFIQTVPDIALYTCIYSSLHTCMLAGVHLGVGSVLFDQEIKNEDTRYIRLQLTYPFFAPIFSSIFTCCYWAFPYTQLNALYSVLGIGIVYIGVLIGDSFYAIKRKTLPMWYRDLKMNTTFIALSGIFMLLYGIYTFPKETKHISLTYPKTIQELKSEI